MKKVLTFNRRLRRRQNFSPHQPQIGEGAKWPISAMVVGQAPFAPPLMYAPALPPRAEILQSKLPPSGDRGGHWEGAWGACPPPSPKSAISPPPPKSGWGAKIFAGAEGAGEKLALFSSGKWSLFSENCICEWKSRKFFASGGVLFCTAFLILYPKSNNHIYSLYMIQKWRNL